MKFDLTSLGKISEFIEKNASAAPIIAADDINLYRVRDYIIKFNNNAWEVYQYGELVETFSFRNWAIGYAVARISKNTRVSIYLSETETKLVRLMNDKTLYDYHRKQAISRNDDTKRSIIESRLSRTDRDIAELMDDTRQILTYQRVG